MSITHNFMAHQVSTVLLNQLRTDKSDSWATSQLTNKATLWQGKADWPRPDIAFEDRSTGSSFAIEFKPPNHVKREYITGLGQTVTYLADFQYSGLVMPELSSDGFEIGKYIQDLLDTELHTLPIALFTYENDPKIIKVRRKLCERQSIKSRIPKGVGRKVFWGYWRDLSQYDLYQLLLIADSKNQNEFDEIFSEYWSKQAIWGKARTWEGRTRVRKKESSYKGEKLNAWLAMRHSGMITDNAKLTEMGYQLLHTGKVYGAQSTAFCDMIARLVLIEGGHLELILWVEEQHRFLNLQEKNSSNNYYDALDNLLVGAGVIAPRSSGARKLHFLRDEPKLWNKLDLLVKNKKKYFHKGIGFIFDWRKIVSILR